LGSVLPSPKIKDQLSFQFSFELFLLNAGNCQISLSLVIIKSEQIKEITNRAAEQLVATLQAGRSEALTAYLKAIGRFHRYGA
jgi:hypothetical protein